MLLTQHIEWINSHGQLFWIEGDTPVPALSQALHRVHQTVRPLPDAQGRTGTCAGCHPAHRQDGSMDGYPITPKGLNFYADSDNRDTKEVNAKLEKPVNFLANWCQNKGIRRGVSGAYLL